MDVTAALNMATSVHSKRSMVEDTCVSLYQGSDFINLFRFRANFRRFSTVGHVQTDGTLLWLRKAKSELC